MLTSELGSAFTAIKEDYEGYKVVNLLKSAVDLLASKGKINEESYAKSADQILIKAKELGEHNIYQFQSDRLKDLISRSKYARAAPSVISSVMLNGINTSANFGMSSSEMTLFLDRAQSTYADITNYLKILENVGLPLDVNNNADVSLNLYLPSSIYENDLGVLSKKLEIYDRFLSSVTEILPSSEKPHIVATSDGSILVILAAAAPVIDAVAKAWSSITLAAIDTIKFKSAVDTMRTVGVPAEAIEAADALIDKKVISELHEALGEQFENSWKKMSKGDANAALLKLRNTASLIVDDTKKGVRISISVSIDASKHLIEETDINQLDLAKLIENQADQQKILNSAIANSQPPKQIGSPAR